jgi:D-alanyl-D-alanine carboxypeptidase
MRIAAVVVALVVSGCGSAAGPSTAVPSPVTSPTASSVPTPDLVTASPRQAELAELLERKRSETGAPGILAEIRHGDAVVRLASGSADMAGNPITGETRFRIASITKPIVAALVLLAVERDLLSLDDEVGELLPGAIREDPPITVRQLLDHTSGVFDEGNEGDPIADVERLADPALQREARSLLKRLQAGEHLVVPDRVIVGLAETHERYFAPGTGYHYSNVNYQLAAMVLERVTGEPLAELLRAWIVEPLGLTRTSLAPDDTTTPELHGYDPAAGSGELADVSDQLTYFGNGGNGGVLSTAAELLTIMQGVQSGRLLPAELVAAMRTPPRGSYGLGLARYRLTCGTFYGHEGAVLGTRSIALVSEDTADGVVIALNVFPVRDPALASLADDLVCRPS